MHFWAAVILKRRIINPESVESLFWITLFQMVRKFLKQRKMKTDLKLFEQQTI